MSDRRSTTSVVAQENANQTLQAFALDDEIIDVAFFLQNPGYLEFQFRSRNIYAGMLGRNGVAYSRQHIGDRISHEITPLFNCRFLIFDFRFDKTRSPGKSAIGNWQSKMSTTSSTSRRRGSVPAAPTRESRCDRD